jgi:hypothetical protein
MTWLLLTLVTQPLWAQNAVSLFQENFATGVPGELPPIWTLSKAGSRAALDDTQSHSSPYAVRVIGGDDRSNVMRSVTFPTPLTAFRVTVWAYVNKETQGFGLATMHLTFVDGSKVWFNPPELRTVNAEPGKWIEYTVKYLAPIGKSVSGLVLYLNKDKLGDVWFDDITISTQ